MYSYFAINGVDQVEILNTQFITLLISRLDGSALGDKARSLLSPT